MVGVALLSSGLTVALDGRAQDGAPIPGRWAAALRLNQYEVGGTIQTQAGAIPTTRAQAVELQALADRLEQIFRQTPALNPPPPGYEARFESSVDYADHESARHRAGDPIPLLAAIYFYELFRECDTCPVRRSVEPSGWIQFFVNDVATALDRTGPAPQAPGEAQWWMLKRVIGEERGTSVYEGGHGRFIFAASARPLGIPVSRGSFLTRVIADLRRNVAGARRDIAAAPAEQQQALREMETAAVELARTNPAAAETLRQQIRETRAALAAASAPAAAEASKGLAAVDGMIEDIERERAGMTDAQLREPALQATGEWEIYRETAIVREERPVPPGIDLSRKMSAFPAQRLGLADRGVVRVGLKADLAVFDPARVRDRATFTAPHQYAEGVSTVVVNGQVVFEQGTMTAARPGRVLYGPSRR
jgi:hypothetical protein